MLASTKGAMTSFLSFVLSFLNCKQGLRIEKSNITIKVNCLKRDSTQPFQARKSSGSAATMSTCK
ncbi:hypothetical protein HanRHA438_Chr02g0048451 [Helianthus annuus]|nr:hypothetical protein HanOQP8_Chr02g0040251 [Helianthus annuus]KAJ0938314.1 hypothetical protein HanRHA438_Chr02g0048451 [Helianthus annuus]